MLSSNFSPFNPSLLSAPLLLSEYIFLFLDVKLGILLHVKWVLDISPFPPSQFSLFLNVDLRSNSMIFLHAFSILLDLTNAPTPTPNPLMFFNVSVIIKCVVDSDFDAIKP